MRFKPRALHVFGGFAVIVIALIVFQMGEYVALGRFERQLPQRMQTLQKLLGSEGGSQDRTDSAVEWQRLEELRTSREEQRNTLQLLTSIAIMLATLVVAWATYKYVGLTHEIVLNSRSELAHALERDKTVERQTRRLLVALARRLRSEALSLPESIETIHTMPGLPWVDKDLQDLELFASSRGVEETKYASTAVSNLRWIANKLEELEKAPSTDRPQLRRLGATDWVAKRSAAIEELSALLSKCAPLEAFYA